MVWGTLSGVLQGILRLALSLLRAGTEARTCGVNVEQGAASLSSLCAVGGGSSAL